jgi:hypothetical protein
MNNSEEKMDEPTKENAEKPVRENVNKPARKRYMLVLRATFILVIMIIIALAFIKKSSVEIELIAVVDELAFSTPEEIGIQRFASDLELKEISFSRVGTLENTNGQVTLPEQANTSFAIELNPFVLQNDSAVGDVPIYIEQILLEPSSRVHLIAAENSQYRAYLLAEELSLDFSVSIDQMDVILGGQLVEDGVDAFEFVTVFAPPNVGDVQEPSRKALLFDFTLTGQGQDSTLNSQIQPKVVAEQRAVEALTLTRANVFADDNLTITERVSTIQSGELYLEGTDGRQFTLRPGERLRFDSSEGLMRLIRLQDDGIYFHFQGKVTGMKTGSYDSPDSLMPSILEFFVSKTSIAAVGLTILGIVLSLLTSFNDLTKNAKDQ